MNKEVLQLALGTEEDHEVRPLEQDEILKVVKENPGITSTTVTVQINIAHTNALRVLLGQELFRYHFVMYSPCTVLNLS